jgi:hypothetical protein
VVASGNDNNRYVQQRTDGKWEGVKEDHQRAGVVADTQKEVIDRTREIVRNAGGGELVIKGRNGRIRDSDTVAPGNESRTRDTK